MLELLVEVGNALFEQMLLVVDLDAAETLAPQLLENVLELALAVTHDRRVHGEARPLRQREDLVDDRLEALPGDRAAADRAMGPTHAGIEEAQVVVDLGDRADRRAWVS